MVNYPPNASSPASRVLSPRQKLFREIKLMLGDRLVKVELLPDHYEVAFDLALDRYRQRSANSVEQRIGVLELIEGQSEYYLPEDVIEVISLHRRGISGSATGSGSNFDPFSAVFATQFAFPGIGAGPLSGGVAGDLVTYEIVAEYQQMLSRMLGGRLDFNWQSSEHRLNINRYIGANESIVMLLYTFRTEEALLKDTYARNWLRDYTLARLQMFLGEAREKFGSIAGPQGPINLNGAALKAEAQAEMARLEAEVKAFADQSAGMPFCFG